MGKLTKKCAVCNDAFRVWKGSYNERWYCSHECRFEADRYKRKQFSTTNLCELCENPYVVTIAKVHTRKYCSPSCTSKARWEAQRVQQYDYKPTDVVQINNEDGTITQHCEKYSLSVEIVIKELNRGRTLRQIFNRRVTGGKTVNATTVTRKPTIEEVTTDSLKDFLRNYGWSC